jgi:hypothetical protein
MIYGLECIEEEFLINNGSATFAFIDLDFSKS